MLALSSLAPLLLLSRIAFAYDSGVHRILGPQAVNIWHLDKLQQQKTTAAPVLQEQGAVGYGYNTAKNDYEEFPEQWFEQPLDHFDASNNHTFKQRYWVNKRHYQAGEGGPVYVLDGGETSGAGRLPYLDTGIMDILTRTTGGVGIVLEHRYYGESIAVQNLSTDSLRWLNNDQAAADSANFMANVKFEGIHEDLTAPNTPWIYYGGSYAGARAAHMKILYPELVYGAIASSAVTHAALSNWEYMDVIRLAAPEKCSEHLVNTIKTIDSILTDHQFLVGPLKNLFGLGDIVHNDDFASVLEYPLSAWQSKCWVPEVNSPAFAEFCAKIEQPPFHLAEIHGAEKAQALMDLPYEHPSRMLTLPGGLAVDFSVLNYASYVKENVVTICPEGFSTEECFGSYDDSKFVDTGLDQDWRLWQFQVCTEWGYFTTAPPDPAHPRIISKLLDLEYESKLCRQAFPPGEHFTVPVFPNITAVNALGDFDIAADRLAFIDGEVDPWRPDTPQSSYYARTRPDTLLRPVKLIPNGVHHYDEWGYADLADEPEEIRKVHGEMIVFVMEWLKDWNVTSTTTD